MSTIVAFVLTAHLLDILQLLREVGTTALQRSLVSQLKIIISLKVEEEIDVKDQ